MDPVPHAAGRSEVEIHYDVCGLPSGAPYHGRFRIAQQGAKTKKKSAKPKPVVISFKDQVDGVATRRHRQVDLASAKRGMYTIELSVTDSRGRVRRKMQKVSIKAEGR
jgi:hypothetical protein